MVKVLLSDLIVSRDIHSFPICDNKITFLSGIGEGNFNTTVCASAINPESKSSRRQYLPIDSGLIVVMTNLDCFLPV